MQFFRAVCAALALCSATALSMAATATDPIPEDRLRALAAVVQGFVDTEEIVGAELLVMQGRRVALHEGFGWRDRDRGIRMEPDTLFNIRSMTKPMTGSLALTLIDEGWLTYEGKVSEHIPAFAAGNSAEITIDHLLTHRSGLPMSLLKGFPDTSLYEIAQQVGVHGPDHTPGEAFHYSDSGSDALGAVVEAAAGQPLGELFRTRLFEPLMMADAHAPLGDSHDAGRPVATAYVMQEGAWTPYWTSESPPLYTVAMGAQGVHATPREYARFMEMWLDGGRAGGTRILSTEAVERA
ncbi:beta-lactamase family protein, partial [Candidatus Poribacteria bacterium]|nr:beta-lactamase family protein [Candidatus Poribacteria bacterium]